MKVVQVKLNLCHYKCQCWMQEHYYWGKSDKETKKNLKSLNTKVGQIQLRSFCLVCNDISSNLFHCFLTPAPRKKQRSADLPNKSHQFNCQENDSDKLKTAIVLCKAATFYITWNIGCCGRERGEKQVRSVQELRSTFGHLKNFKITQSFVKVELGLIWFHELGHFLTQFW